MSPPLKLINLTTQEVWIEADHGVVILPRVRHRAHVSVHYQRPADSVFADVVDGVTGQAKRVRVSWPQWGAHRTRDDAGRETSVEHLPAPAAGIGYVVSGMVAEQAALDGRSLDDLFVVLEVVKDDMSRTMASIIPAAKATPGMFEVIAAGRRRQAVVTAHRMLRQLARLVGEPFAYGEFSGFLVRTSRGVAYLRDGQDELDLITADGDTVEAAAGLAAALETEAGDIIDALRYAPVPGPVRPGEVRRVVIGAHDPESAAIVTLCQRLGVPTVSLDSVGHALDGDLFVECRPAGTGRGRPETWRLDVPRRQFRTVGHRHPGDPGFGIPPAGYLLASSIGQVAMALGGLHLLTEYDRVTAACSHCLGPALQGRCPGVSTADVEAWLQQHEPDRKDGWRVIDKTDLEAELVAVSRAPIVQLSADIVAVDLRGLPLSFAASYIGTFRRDQRTFVYDKEVSRPPVDWPKGQPCRRVSMQGMISESHFSAFRMWAERQGAVDFFPDADPRAGAARGYAGFYI